MHSKLPSVTLKAIGIVRNEVSQAPATGYDWQNVVSEIVLDNSLTEGLDDLEKFSHIIIIYWMHKSTGPVPLKIHPKHRAELPLMGVFATRSPSRPNPVGKATVKLLQHRGNVLKVKGLDAFNGTPVIDIKPYIPGYDTVRRAKAPSWTSIR